MGGLGCVTECNGFVTIGIWFQSGLSGMMRARLLGSVNN